MALSRLLSLSTWIKTAAKEHTDCRIPMGDSPIVKHTDGEVTDGEGTDLQTGWLTARPTVARTDGKQSKGRNRKNGRRSIVDPDRMQTGKLKELCGEERCGIKRSNSTSGAAVGPPGAAVMFDGAVDTWTWQPRFRAKCDSSSGEGEGRGMPGHQWGV